MPYLHWETQQQRQKMAEIIKVESQKYNPSRSHVTESLREKIYKTTVALMEKHTHQLLEISTPKESEEKMEAAKKCKKFATNPLGLYLLQVAKV
jgi:dTDP-4-amino-4,6-dideoxygalactose transaminase